MIKKTFALNIRTMPWFPWLKKKETPEQKNAREAKEATAKGLVESYHEEMGPGQYGMPEPYRVKNWVTPEVAEQRIKERLKQEADAKEQYTILQKRYREEEAAEKKRARDKKLAECKAFIAQVEAEEKKLRSGGKRFTTRRNRKSKRNTRTMKHL